MAKVSGPLMSLDARGKFAGALVFSGWKGRPTVRQLVTPANPFSANQVAARNKVRVTAAAQHQINLSTQILSGKTAKDKTLIIAASPSGQAWNGTLVKAMIGAGDANYTAAEAIWNGLLAGEKTAWDNAANARVPAYPAVAQKIAGGGAGVAVTSGNVYLHTMYGLYVLGITTIPTAVPPVYA